MTLEYWLLLAMAVVVVIVAVGSGSTLFFYRRLGYPSTPGFMNAISLRDDIETVWERIQPALKDGFKVKQRTSELLILQKTYVDPPSVMTISFDRPPGNWQWNLTDLSVKCVGRPWLNYRRTQGSNAIWRRKTHGKGDAAH